MPISVHDNRLKRYTVNEGNKTILLETIFRDAETDEITNVLFSGVAAYFFENHSLQLGTIIHDIEEVDTATLLDSNWRKFEGGKKWGWPGYWAETKESAQTYFNENEIRAYDISSSCGLCGWVLAQGMEISASGQQP